MTRTMPWGAQDAAPPWSALLLKATAAALRGASVLLERRAARLTASAIAQAQADADALLNAGADTVEFHAVYRDAGAPEGALYINGELVGTICGVKRL